MSDETRTLSEYERSLLAPHIQAFERAQAGLQTAVALLAGEAWKGCPFDLATMTFTRPAPDGG